MSLFTYAKQKRTAVIGGGLSGLYAAYLLTESNHAVDLYESDKQVGGLVYTSRHWGCAWRALLQKIPVAVESGPSHHLSTQKRIMQLVKKLKLIQQRTPTLPCYTFGSEQEVPVEELTKQLATACEENTHEHTFVNEVVGNENSDIQAFLPWWDEIKNFTCQDFLVGFHAEKDATLYYLPGGYTELIKALYKVLVDRGVQLYTNTRVTCVYESHNRVEISTKMKTQIYDAAVLAIPVAALEKITIVGKELQHAVSYATTNNLPQRSIRVYVLYTEKREFLQELIRQNKRNLVSSQHEFRWAMVVSADVLLLSYVDSDRADTLYEKLQHNKDKAVVDLLIGFNDFMCGFEIDSNKSAPNMREGDAVVIGGAHGPSAYHINQKHSYNEKKLCGLRTALAGEATSAPHLRAWMEGALQSAERACAAL
jgi:monoamine oxidase